MDWWHALLLGLVQGLTEFLPVSSSGHLEIGRRLLGAGVAEDLDFEIVLHCATVLATIFVFRKRIWELLKGFFKFEYNDQTDYLLKIIVSMIPVFVAGMFFRERIEALFSTIEVVGAALLVTAALLVLSDIIAPKVAERGNVARGGISWWQAFVVGIGQALAVIPGLSRSGTTIATGLLCGVDRKRMAEFSFLMVLVPVLGEAFLDLVGGGLSSSSTGILPMTVGFAAAFVSGIFACRVMVALVSRSRLGWFGLYCAAAGVLVLLFL
ncbi:MAG: undecaprenyl-diphosphate phosphatase [Bacteroidales bacterium]|nr:undecaprenyl-diphosphate phosphatase [Bacteroidales bacterium]